MTQFELAVQAIEDHVRASMAMLVRDAVAAEREACAVLADASVKQGLLNVGSVIRARGNAPPPQSRGRDY